MKHSNLDYAFAMIAGIGLGAIVHLATKDIDLSMGKRALIEGTAYSFGSAMALDLLRKKEKPFTERLQEERQNQQSEQLRV